MTALLKALYWWHPPTPAIFLLTAQLAVRSLDLAIHKGECFGLLGPNGAGKSTSISMLVGLVEPSAGTALIGGNDITSDMDAIYRCDMICAWYCTSSPFTAPCLGLHFGL